MCKRERERETKKNVTYLCTYCGNNRVNQKVLRFASGPNTRYWNEIICGGSLIAHAISSVCGCVFFLETGMTSVCKLTPSDIRQAIGLTKSDIIASLAKTNTDNLGSYPLKMLKAATQLEDADVEFLMCVFICSTIATPRPSPNPTQPASK